MEKLIKELLLNKEINKFVSDNKLTDDDILNNYSVFAMKKETDDVCEKCLKNGVCENKSDFSKCVLENKNGRVKAKFVDCEYQNKGQLSTYFYEQKNEELFLTNARGMVFKELARFKKEYIETGRSKGVYIYGGYGQGKSFILYSFAKELVKSGKKVIYAYYPDLVRQIKSSIGTNQMETLLLELKKVDVLMLDDLGGENNTAFVRDEILGPILQYRMNEELPVFATSNYNFLQLVEHFADTSLETDKLKAGRILQRIQYLMNSVELKDLDYRNNSK